MTDDQVKRRQGVAHETSSFDFQEKSPFQQFLGSLFGFDFFISYAWADGRDYAVELAQKLEGESAGKRYSCFLDSDDYAKGDDWKDFGEQALRRTSILVLIGSPRALQSQPVLREVQIFKETKRRIIPIEFIDDDGRSTLDAMNHSSPIHNYLPPEVLRIRAPHQHRPDSQQLAGPSVDVVKQLTESFDIITHAEKRARAFGAAAIIFAIVAILAVVFWRTAEANRQLAERRRQQNLQQLHKASMAAIAASSKAWQEDYDATQSGARAESLDGTSKWHESIAHLTRALEYEPGSTQAAFGLYNRLIHRGRQKWDLAALTVPHDNEVHAASFSPDGSKILTICRDNKARLWNAVTGTLIGQPMEHAGEIHTAIFSSDGSKILTGSLDKTAQIWDAGTTKRIGIPLQPTDGVASAAFSLDGSKVVTTTLEKTASIWNARTSEVIGEPLEHGARVTAAAFSPDGTLIVTTSWDQFCKIWNADSGQQIGQSLPHSQGVRTAIFSPDGSRIATVSENVVRLWDTATCEPVQLPWGHEYKHLDPVTAICWSPDGSNLVIGSDGTAEIWNVATGVRTGQPLQHARIDAASFSPDGSKIVTRGATSARIWDAATGRSIGEPLRHAKYCPSASFSPDGSRIVTASWDGTARIWDCFESIEVALPLRHSGMVKTVNFSPDGSKVVTTGLDKTARIWDTATGQPLVGPLLHEDEVTIASFSPDGSKVVTACRKVDYRRIVLSAYAQVWDVVSGIPVGAPIRHKGEIKAAAFSPNGRTLVTASFDQTAVISATATGQPVCPPLPHAGEVTTASFSPDGSKVVTGCQMVEGASNYSGYVQLWDVRGNPIGQQLQDDGGITIACFSPDGAKIFTGCMKTENTATGMVTLGHARFWDVASGQPLGEKLMHDGKVNSASFSRDGSKVVTASDDGTARIWDETSGQLLTILRHSYANVFANFSADGTKVVTVSYAPMDDRGYAQVWDVTDGQPIGEPLRHEDSHEHEVVAAVISADGSKVITASSDQTARIWDLGSREETAQMVQQSSSVLQWAGAVGGLQFRENGELQVLGTTDRQKTFSSGDLSTGSWAELAEWLRTRGPNGKLSPKSIETLRQIAERERDFGSRESLESALRYDPTVPLARLMLANLLETAELAKGEGEGEPDTAVIARAAHWRRYDLDRLPDDPQLRARAAEILRQLPEAKVGVGPQPTTAAKEADRLSAQPAA